MAPAPVSATYLACPVLDPTAVHWENTLQARELAFSGQEEILPMLREYFDRFDYSPYRPSA